MTDKSTLTDRLHTKWAGQVLYCHDCTGSTNTDARELAQKGAPHGAVVTAEIQTAGKGRRGRTWESPAGVSVYFSILLKPEFAPDKASMLTLVMAVSVAQAVEELMGEAVQIKWPNDIVIHHKKVCGILTEMSVVPKSDRMEYVVVGVGVNVNQASAADFTEEIRQTATSMRIEGQDKSTYDRAEVLAGILTRFELNYESFVRELSMKPLWQAYQSHLVNVDRQVRVLDPAGEYTGISRGINEKGELLVEMPDGTVVCVYAGEVSVRGMYGYVN